MAKKMKKIIMGSGAAFLVIMLTVLYIAAFHLGSIVKKGIETFMPSITGTPVEVGSVTCLPFSGHINVKNFVIYNPGGYKSEYAFKVKEFTVTVKPMSVLSDKIFISKILVDGLSVSYEQSLTGCNLTDIKNNIDKLSAKNAQEEEKPAEKAAPEESGAPKAEKRFQIKEFDFQNSSVKVSTPLTEGRGVALPIPGIHIRELGMKDDKGVTGYEMAPVIFGEIITATVDAVKNSSVKISGDTLDSLKTGGKEILNNPENLIKGVRDLFQKK